GTDEGLRELLTRARRLAHSEPHVRLRVPLCMSGRDAESDQRPPEDERLEAGDAAGRMDDHVGGGDQLTHTVRVAEDLRPGLTFEGRDESSDGLVVQAADAD